MSSFMSNPMLTLILMLIAPFNLFYFSHVNMAPKLSALLAAYSRRSWVSPFAYSPLVASWNLYVNLCENSIVSTLYT